MTVRSALISVLEYHPHMCPGGNPRAEAEAILRAAGMKIAPIKQVPGGYGMLWAWRP